jgi:hypothetical protein
VSVLESMVNDFPPDTSETRPLPVALATGSPGGTFIGEDGPLPWSFCVSVDHGQSIAYRRTGASVASQCLSTLTPPLAQNGYKQFRSGRKKLRHRAGQRFCEHPEFRVVHSTQAGFDF